MSPTFQSDDGRVTLYRGDCLEILPHLTGIDAVVTDPPYGVNLGNNGSAKDGRSNRVLIKGSYGSYDDTYKNFESLIVPRICLAIKIAKRSLVFCAMPQGFNFPKPDVVGGVFIPAGHGRNKWGFNCLAHYFLYGQAPALNLGSKPTAFQSTAISEHVDHPCPKPIPWMLKTVKLCSIRGELVCDPMMGSGTTGIACLRTGRRFVGIEIDPHYYQVAEDRIKRELAQGLLELK